MYSTSHIDIVIKELINATREDFLVADIDPIQADEFLCNSLPLLNSKSDYNSILKSAYLFCEKAKFFSNPSRLEALAIQRDIGFIAASLTKHKISLPDFLESTLSHFSLVTQEVPRDTVFSYGPRNPQNNRRRKFTNLEAEDIFISSFVQGMGKNLDCLTNLMKSLETDIESENFYNNIQEATKSFSTMLDAMLVVHQQITPQIFTFELRPYFEPITINNKLYYGPGGAQMPVILIDMLLWGKSCTENEYIDYFEENISYSPIYYRNLLQKIEFLPCMMTKINELSNTVSNSLQVKSLEALQDLLTSIVRFRHVHLAVAKSNFKLRTSEDKGSGGYNTEILEKLLDQVTSMRNHIKIKIDEGKNEK